MLNIFFFLSFHNSCFSEENKKYHIVHRVKSPKKKSQKLKVEEEVSIEFHFKYIKIYKATKFI